MIPSTSTQPYPRNERIWKNRTMSKMPSIRKSDASTKVRVATPSTGCMMRYAPKNRYASPTSSFQIKSASPMSVKGEDYVDYTCQNDEPSNDHVDGNGREKWRTDRQNSKNNQQDTPKD